MLCIYLLQIISICVKCTFLIPQCGIHTLQKKLFDLEKHFKICYVYVKRKPKSFFLFFILSHFVFYLYEWIPWSNVYVVVDIPKKLVVGFSFYIKIANFEAFSWKFLLSTNLLFLKSVLLGRKNEKSYDCCSLG